MRSLIAEGLDARLVVSPARADLDPDLQEHFAAGQRFEFVPRFSADTLELFALLANDHALVTFALNHDGGSDPAQISLFLVLVNQHRRRVRPVSYTHLRAHETVLD